MVRPRAAPGFQPCTLSVGGRRRAPRRLSFSLGRGRRARGSGRRRRLAPGGSRAPKIASALHLHPKGSRVHLLRALHARARRSRARRRPIFFLRIRLVAAVARAQRATGSTSPPAGLHRKAMGLGRVLAPEFQPCTLSVGGTAPRAAPVLLALAVAVELGGQDRRRRLAPGGSRVSENRECIASASERVPRSPASCTTRAREAEPSPPPADFLFANPVGGGGGASTASYRVASPTAGSHQEGDGSRPCARAEDFSRALYPLAVRRRAPRWLTFSLGRGRRARGSRIAAGGSHQEGLALRKSRVHCICIRKGPAFTCFVHYTRARGGAEPAAGRFSFCESGWWRRWREHSELRGRVDDRRLAPEGDGSRPCARARISAVHFIRWRYGAARRAELLACPPGHLARHCRRLAWQGEALSAVSSSPAWPARRNERKQGDC